MHDILKKAIKILEQPVCDHCLGRQFAQLLHGFTNEQRGKNIRVLVAMALDKEKISVKVDFSNFHKIKFHYLDKKILKPKKCVICGNVFETLEKWIERIKKAIKGKEIKSFVIGSKLSYELLGKEEALWERTGIEFCEPIKAEINREVGKLIEKMGLKFDPENPDAIIILNLSSKKVQVQLNPLFIYGEYQKLVRGVPQTKWPSKKHKTSIEEIIAKPLMKLTKGKGHKFHGSGREDIDARCFGWRPFVIEILNPKIRTVNLKIIEKEVNKTKKVKVRRLRYSTIKEVRKLKESKKDKIYRIIVKTEKEIDKKDLRKLKALETTITQQTPKRVVHRRSDKTRKRLVKKVKAKLINKKCFELIIESEAGLYVKEFVTGDCGRTRPSVASVLDCNCEGKDLDVMKIKR